MLIISSFYTDVCPSSELKVMKDHITYGLEGLKDISEETTLTTIRVILKKHPEASASKPYKVHWYDFQTRTWYV